MPTYSYACKDCDHAFDIRQPFTDSSLTICPECDGSLRKKFNSVGVVFKGSGFYRTDSRDAKTATSGSNNGSKESVSSTSDAGGSSDSAGGGQGKTQGSDAGSSSAKTSGTKTSGSASASSSSAAGSASGRAAGS